jgi:glycosyltransferase involved in cell wall biosynthesis
VLHTEHGRKKPDPVIGRIVDGLAARRTDVVVAVSERLAEELPSALRISPDSVALIRNGIDTEAYAPKPDTGAVRRELGLDMSVPVIGSIGRLTPIKGYDVMIEAFARFRALNTCPDAVLVLAGDGGDRAKLETLAAARGLQGRVHFLGWRDDVHGLHSMFQVFTMSSRSEGTSISLLEAMSAGLPPIVTDVGGNGAVLGPELAHCLVPSEHPEALARQWARALADPAIRAIDSGRARARVVGAFGRDAMVEAYERLYCEAK